MTNSVLVLDIFILVFLALGIVQFAIWRKPGQDRSFIGFLWLFNVPIRLLGTITPFDIFLSVAYGILGVAFLTEKHWRKDS